MNLIPGWMTRTECMILRELFSPYNSENCVGVEVGSFLGRSSWEISNSISLGKLYCIDKWDDWVFIKEDKNYNNKVLPDSGTKGNLTNFLKNTRGCNNIITIQAACPNAIVDWNQQIDFLFLDAAHTNPSDREWIDYWLPKIKPGGILAGHDFDMSNTNRYPDIHANIRYLQTLLNKKVNITRTVTQTETSIWYFDI